MSWLFRASFKTHSELIQHLFNSNIITHIEVKNALLKVDRKDFISHNPYMDSPQYIGFNATISAPHMHAHALNGLKNHLNPGMKALDIGSGSGYLAVCMAYMVGDKGKVIGIEHIRELCDLSITNINKNHSILLKTKNIEIICGDGRKGYIDESPFDCIHVGAATKEDIANNLCNQLKNGGKMVIPVELSNGEQIFREYLKDQNGKISFKNMVEVRYVPLTNENDQRNSGLFG